MSFELVRVLRLCMEKVLYNEERTRLLSVKTETRVLLGRSLNPRHKLAQFGLEEFGVLGFPQTVQSRLNSGSEVAPKAMAFASHGTGLRARNLELKSCSLVTSYVVLGHYVTYLEKLLRFMGVPTCLCV